MGNIAHFVFLLLFIAALSHPAPLPPPNLCRRQTPHKTRPALSRRIGALYRTFGAEIGIAGYAPPGIITAEREKLP